MNYAELDARITSESPYEMTEAEEDAAYAEHAEALRDYAQQVLDETPKQDHAGLMVALARELGNRKGNEISTTPRPMSQSEIEELIRRKREATAGNGCNRRAQFTSNPATLAMTGK